MIAGKLCHYPEDVRQLFHDPIRALELEIESYLGVPLLDPQGNTLGHLAVLDDRPMPSEAKRLYVFRIFAARAAGKLCACEQKNCYGRASDDFAICFRSAPIAYLIEDSDSGERAPTVAPCAIPWS